MKKPFKWSEEKNQKIQKERGLSFEMLENLEPIIRFPNHNPEKYPGQHAFLYEINNYPVFVPFVEEDEYIFLKNMFYKRQFKHFLNS